MLIKSKIFWIATVIFLCLSLSLIWFIYLSLIGQYRSQKSELNKVKNDIVSQEKLLANINKLKTQEDELNQDYQLLTRALPVSTSPEILLVELDGLTKQLLINDAKITIPFDQVQADKSSQSSASESSNTGKGDASSSSNDDNVQPGSQGSSSPTVNSQNSSKPLITIAGEFGFDKVKELLVSLRGFIRLNKITAITINNSTDKVNSTISTQVYTKADVQTGYTGSDNLLLEAQKLIDQLKTYTNLPDITTEGNFGRTDPFQVVK